MKSLLGYRHLAIEKKIMREFGNGTLQADECLFDQIRLPEGWSERRVPPSELLAIVKGLGKVIVLIDRNPDSYRLAVEYIQRFGLPAFTAAEVEADEIGPLLTWDRTDMYITTLEGELLAIACHEDLEVNGVRQIWMPVRPSCTKTPAPEAGTEASAVQGEEWEQDGGR